MSSHQFIFQPGVWLGEGKVNLSISDEMLKFSTRWNVEDPQKKGNITTLQEVQIKGLEDVMKNKLTFSDFSGGEFSVHLENENVGKIIGRGIVKPKTIAWEFRSEDKEFEGFEVYELQEDGGYFMHAEYVTKDEFRTLIQGKIWKKSKSA